MYWLPRTELDNYYLEITVVMLLIILFLMTISILLRRSIEKDRISARYG